MWRVVYYSHVESTGMTTSSILLTCGKHWHDHIIYSTHMWKALAWPHHLFYSHVDSTGMTTSSILLTCGQHWHDHIIYSQRGKAWAHKTSLTPPCCIAVSLPSQESEWSCAPGVSNLSLFLRFVDWNLELNSMVFFIILLPIITIKVNYCIFVMS
jgi:hypothetical protein